MSSKNRSCRKVDSIRSDVIHDERSGRSGRGFRHAVDRELERLGIDRIGAREIDVRGEALAVFDGADMRFPSLGSVSPRDPKPSR